MLLELCPTWNSFPEMESSGAAPEMDHVKAVRRSSQQLRLGAQLDAAHLPGAGCGSPSSLVKQLLERGHEVPSPDSDRHDFRPQSATTSCESDDGSARESTLERPDAVACRKYNIDRWPPSCP